MVGRRGGGGAIAAALAAALAGAPGASGAERPPVPLQVSCESGAVTLSARAAPAGEVFAALGGACGLELRGADLLPGTAVTAEYRGTDLETVVRDLARIAGIRSTLTATGAGAPPLLVILPAGPGGTSGVREGGQGGGGIAAGLRLPPLPGGEEVREALASRPGSGDPALLLELVRVVDHAEAWIAEGLPLQDLLELRAEAALEEALRRCHAAGTEEQRREALAALRAAGPSPASGEAWTEEEVADERWRISWESARDEALLGAAAGERRSALERLRGLNPDEAEYLRGLGDGALAEEQRAALVEALLERYYLARTPEQWRDALSTRAPDGDPAPGGGAP